MVDNLRYELTQVARRCKGIQLGLPEINKILNGKFSDVIDEFKAQPVPEQEPEQELQIPVETEPETVEEQVPDAEEKQEE